MSNVSQQGAAPQLSAEQFTLLLNELKKAQVQEEQQAQQQEYNAALDEWYSAQTSGEIIQNLNTDSAIFSSVNDAKQKEETKEKEGIFDKILNAIFGKDDDESNPFKMVEDTLDMVSTINPKFAKKGYSLLDDYNRTLKAMSEGYVSYEPGHVGLQNMDEFAI